MRCLSRKIRGRHFFFHCSLLTLKLWTVLDNTIRYIRVTLIGHVAYF
jgi:hypothetical protein